ncbi:DUF115 domain-containing protein [Entomospira nematocerorum]|uniref:Motility associated factor glycosyltransferase family protein n=1 Tax=Entomospira nematocerorum TaxID=2719987 RepID=A0A968KTR0_9SPIO|nr:6-hydroxymethylpterin diphosphokinase MptE-like protein [Entomospira nematocera]NIZ46459.1 motility associated factor glycosyltransferase family protein [Entomospira nematocera]WDI33739.1 DUF115 domain-containing protein [Entomospira nematocera]
MDLVTAKNNEYTIKIHSHWIHSTYHPTREAERFIQNFLLQHYQEGQIILIIGSGLGYLEAVLERLYPNISFISIDFSLYPKTLFNDKLIFEYNENNPTSIQNVQRALRQQLLHTITDENISLYALMIWPVSQQIFPSAINFIQEYMNSMRASAATLHYFGWQWLRNGFRNVLWWNKQIILPKYTHVVVIAAGATLEFILPYLLRKRENYFWIVASSAVKACRAHGLEPDLVISIDGGYHAGMYLHDAEGLDILNAFTGIASTNTSFMGLHSSFFDRFVSFSLQPIPFSVWGGTVMATAIHIAEQIATEEIILAGQDLSVINHLTHAKPHHIYNGMLAHHNRYHTLYSSHYPIELHSHATLPLYADWFSQRGVGHNTLLKRLSPSAVDLGIEEISMDRFLSKEAKLYKAAEYRTVPEISVRRCALTQLLQQWEEQLLEHPLSQFLYTEQISQITLAKRIGDIVTVKRSSCDLNERLRERIQFLHGYLR